MTRSSRGRKARARTRKMSRNSMARQNAVVAGEYVEESKPVWSSTDKKYIIGFAILSLLITAFYWWIGGRNLFVFPAVFCISVGARKYWTGPIRKFADKS